MTLAKVFFWFTVYELTSMKTNKHNGTCCVCGFQDLDQETFAHVDTENQRQTLEEQTEFLKSVHDEVQKQNTRP